MKVIWGDCVKVIDGFYKGQIGYIIGISKSHGFRTYTVEITGYINNAYRTEEVNIKEENLKKI